MTLIPTFGSRRAAIVAALERNGWSRTQAAADLGYTVSGFYWACGRYGVELPSETARRGRRVVEDEDVPLILALRRDGMSRREIGEKFGVSASCIQHVERRHGGDGDVR